jgi:hypothetical protein
MWLRDRIAKAGALSNNRDNKAAAADEAHRPPRRYLTEL